MHFTPHLFLLSKSDYPFILTGIDFTEFLDMYKRLFVLSKSVVSQDVHDIVRNSPRSTALPEINHNKPNKVFLKMEQKLKL